MMRKKDLAKSFIENHTISDNMGIPQHIQNVNGIIETIENMDIVTTKSEFIPTKEMHVVFSQTFNQKHISIYN